MRASAIRGRLARWFCVLAAVLAFPSLTVRGQNLTISDAQALAAGKRLWINECAGTVEGLTSWNDGENFASLGIGHYIWYPAGRHGPFEESFPELLRYLEAHGSQLPDWLTAVPPCPWNSRAQFLRERNGPRLTSLRRLLVDTVAVQARFSADRLRASLPKMLETLPARDREQIRLQFFRVAGSPNGVYALVDYVNFKGEGTQPTERYHGEGWGLLQVLAGMPVATASTSGPRATRDFADSAARVLTRRVVNAPLERHESRWLPGWKNRVQTYAP